MGVVRRTTSPRAARLRRQATDAEHALWRQLRDRRLGGHKFRRQRSLWPHVADFCCVASKLIVEVDGGQHTIEGDAARTRALTQQGFRVVRFWNNDVLSNMEGVLRLILEALGGELTKEEEEEEDE